MRPTSALLTLLLGLFASAGCGKSDDDSAGEAPVGPEQTGSILNSPAGVPPAPLVPEFVSLHIVAADDLNKVEAVLRRRFPLGHVASGPPAQAPLLPILRADVGAASALTREAVTELVASGARGSLLFWYPLADVRDRLGEGGTAGVWRGVIAVRDAVPGAGELGGTPLLHAIAVAAADRGLVELETVGPAEAPGAATSLFTGPGGVPVVYLRTRDALTSPGFETLLERLNAVRNQGGKLWVLVGLPLAQPHVPTRF